jgi:hypothetical protein
MSTETASVGAAWVAVTILALTASCLIAVTVAGIRSQQRTGELFGELFIVSLFVPALLFFLATRLPPELFDFLR